MELEDEFRTASYILKDLEHQLQLLSESALAKRQSEAHRAIETNFETCMKALAIRKEALLREVDAHFIEQKKQMESQQSQIKDAINVCRKLMEAGVTIYKQQKSAAMYCWKGAHELKCDLPSIHKIEAKFCEAVVTAIGHHGKVVVVSEVVPFTKAGRVTTHVGSTDGLVDGQGTNAQLNGPRGICLNPVDNCIYVADSSNNMIRKISPEGVVSTFAGKKRDGPFHYPVGVAHNHKENCFYISSQNHTIKKITAAGVVSVFAGSGKEGSEDGMSTSASFKNPAGIVVDQHTGTVYVADSGNNSIRKITPQGLVLTPLKATPDDTGNATPLSNPYGLWYHEKDSSLYVCDFGNNRIVKICVILGKMSTVCEITKPTCVTVSSNGTLIVTSQNKIYKVTQNGEGKYEATVLAGSGKQGNADGAPLDSSFNNPTGLFIDEQSSVCYVTDHLNSRIRKVSLTR